MSNWDDGFREPTEDEKTTRRVLSLAIVLINANRPLLTSEIRGEVYPDLSTAVFRKTFQRDRERLALCGMALRNGKKACDESTWLIDEESSLANRDALTSEEALTLDLLLAPLASDPSIPYAQDLRMALAKIDRSFDDSATHVYLPPEARQRNNSLTRVEGALAARHAITVRYVRSDESETNRTLAPYGLFHFRGDAYLVAAKMDDGVVCDEPPHTYKLGRMHGVREIARLSYEIPADFDVRDYVKLPFQMGEASCEAVFEAQDDMREDVLAALASYESVHRDSDPRRLRTWISDVRIAASWAIAEGVVPIEPSTLVEEWRKQLIRAAKGTD